MRKGTPKLDVDPTAVLDLPLDSALDASEMALWSMNPVTGELHLSEYFYQLLPTAPRPLLHIDQLLAMMPTADNYIFKKNFVRGYDEPNRTHSCAISLGNFIDAPRLRFIGRQISETISTGDHNASATRQMLQGVVVSSRHWLANPGPDYVQHLLRGLFAESPIASFVTDANGIVLQQNHALETLLNLTSRQVSRGIGRYNILRDKSFRADEAALKNLQQVYQSGEVASFKFNYSLGNLHKNKRLSESVLHLRVSFLPMRDQTGKVARVLVQLQDYSHEQSVNTPLQSPNPSRYGSHGVTDSSYQSLTEERLENQRQELHLLLDSIHAAIWYFDRWGLVKDANAVALDFMGSSEALGKSFLELGLCWDDAAERHREIMHVIRTGEAQVKSIESAQIDAQLCWYSVDKIPTKDNSGNVTGVLLMMTDITDALRKERALEENEARYKAFIANSSEAIWCYDMHPPVKVDDDLETQVNAIASAARLVECNQVLARMIGTGTIEGALGSGLIASGSKNFLFDIHHFVNESYQLVDHEIVREDAKGRRMCYQISCMGVVENNVLQRVWGTTKDVTTRKRYQDRLEYQSTHDSLTKLPNRVKLYKEMDHWLRHREEAQMGALLLIDLDRFKEINDTLGHQVGDHLLQLIGPRLETEMADVPGMVARLGGDEFAIFLPQIGSTRQVIVFGHRVLDALRQEFDVDGFCTEISASMGISMAPTQGQDVSTMMRYADVAMYRAKTDMSGLSLYSAEYDPHSPKRLAMMGEVGRAIREDQLFLHFQPKVSLLTGQVYGFEALLRWNHPELGFVPPNDFIPIVELTSLIHPMTAWVLEKSIAQCGLWREKGMNVSVAVNLSARNLLDENIPKQITRLLQEYQLPPSALELEITESSIMTDPTRAMRVLDHLHELGVQLSIDDFGTGYSSLAYLKRLPVKTLKIDNSFVRDMLEDKQDELIVNSTIHLAHNLGLNVVAEGVENEELLQRLRAMGCDEAQGYHIGRPMPADKIDEWIANSPWSITDPVADVPHT